MNFPMLADFSLRLACGLAALLLLTPWRVVPAAFFRTHFQVILGLFVLAVLDASRLGIGGAWLVAMVAAAVLSYVAVVVWGLGLPRVAIPLTVLVVLVSSGVLVAISQSGDTAVWLLNGAGRLSSAFLMGATLTAMLLGHHYLTAPAMSIDPLKRFVRCMAGALVLRALVAAAGLGLWFNAGVSLTHTSGAVSPLFLGVRWGMGLFGPALATYLTWQTVRIRSTQSATGILYIAMTLVLFGELTAMILSRDVGIAF